jgi:hypothetical protein
MTDQHSIFDSDIQGCRVGLDLPPFMGARTNATGVRLNTFTGVYNTYLSNWNNAAFVQPWSVNGANRLPEGLVVLDKVTLAHPSVSCGGCTSGPRNVSMSTSYRRGGNHAALMELLSIDTLGVGKQQAFFATQASGVLFRETGYVPGGTGRAIVGCPSANMTNAQCWAAHQKAQAGAVTPCTTALSGVNGFVCPSSLAVATRSKPQPGQGPTGYTPCFCATGPQSLTTGPNLAGTTTGIVTASSPGVTAGSPSLHAGVSVLVVVAAVALSC